MSEITIHMRLNETTFKKLMKGSTETPRVDEKISSIVPCSKRDESYAIRLAIMQHKRVPHQNIRAELSK